MTPSYRDNELILNYHDAVIYGSDLRLLTSSTAWLNDACVHFQMTRLSRKRSAEKQEQHFFDQSSVACGEGRTVLFMDPAVVSFLMHQCTDEEDMADLNSGLSLHSRSKIFVPVNDNNAASASAFQTPGGGSHWSLLVVQLGHSGCSRMYFHFDSARGHNERAARAVADKIGQVLDVALSSHTSTSELVECRTPQQINGHDCGLFMLAIADALSSPSSRAEDKNDKSSFELALEDHVAERGENFAQMLRRAIANDIMRLAASESKK